MPQIGTQILCHADAVPGVCGRRRGKDRRLFPILTLHLLISLETTSKHHAAPGLQASDRPSLVLNETPSTSRWPLAIKRSPVNS